MAPEKVVHWVPLVAEGSLQEIQEFLPLTQWPMDPCELRQFPPAFLEVLQATVELLAASEPDAMNARATSSEAISDILANE